MQRQVNGCGVLSLFIKDWHRAQRKIECWAITRLDRRGRWAEEPPRLSSTTHYIPGTGQALITVFMSSCKHVYRHMSVAKRMSCYTFQQQLLSWQLFLSNLLVTLFLSGSPRVCLAGCPASLQILIYPSIWPLLSPSPLQVSKRS